MMQIRFSGHFLFSWFIFINDESFLLEARLVNHLNLARFERLDLFQLFKDDYYYCVIALQCMLYRILESRILSSNRYYELLVMNKIK